MHGFYLIIRCITYAFLDGYLLLSKMFFSSQMERDGEFDQEGLELTCLDLFKVLNLNTHTLVVIFLIDTYLDL